VHLTVRHVVADRILEQVRDEPDQQTPVAGHDSRFELDVEVQLELARIGIVLAQRVPGDDREVDRLAAVDPLLPLGEGKQRVDQLLLLLVLLERLATRLAEAVRGGARVGDDHLEQCA
jgi:hypothetical protein